MPKNPKIKKVLVLGSGPIVIGQAAEFDYAGTQACRALKEEGVEVVLVNSNPATIMTDKDIADHVYIEPLNLASVEQVIAKERPDSILPTLGGQTGLNLAMNLHEQGILEKYGVRLLGTSPESIRKAEDRQGFKDAMEAIGQPCVTSDVVESVEAAVEFAGRIGYPVIVRPAYTLGGSGGGIAYDEPSLREIADRGIHLSRVGQVLIERCISGWKEIEFEVMRDSAGNVIQICSMENIDPVGVHTGDSIVVAPTQTLANREYQMLRSASLNIISALEIEGGCNVQLALNPDSFEYAVIEVNPRDDLHVVRRIAGAVGEHHPVEPAGEHRLRRGVGGEHRHLTAPVLEAADHVLLHAVVHQGHPELLPARGGVHLRLLPGHPLHGALHPVGPDALQALRDRKMLRTGDHAVHGPLTAEYSR